MAVLGKRWHPVVPCEEAVRLRSQRLISGGIQEKIELFRTITVSLVIMCFMVFLGITVSFVLFHGNSFP